MGLLVEMELERLGEFLFRVSGRGVFFAETDELLSYVAAFDAAWDALGKELESEGDEGCVLAAEDGGALEGGYRDWEKRFWWKLYSGIWRLTAPSMAPVRGWM